jgi:uncharacterized membrane protein
MARRAEERGAVTIMTALFLVVIVGVASLAVDLGMQRVGKRDMQALSDLVALDMARQLNGSNAATLTSNSAWTTAFTASKARNSTTLGAIPTVTVEVGTIDDTTRQFTAIPNNSTTPVPTAVRVTSQTTINFAFHPGTGGVIAAAVAEAVKSSCFKLGSWAARFNSGDVALISTLPAPANEILRPQANLDAVSYQGLAAATVSVSEIAADSSVGTTTDLLTSKVNLGTLLQATVNALGRQNPPNAVAISALNKIINGQAAMSTPILLGKAGGSLFGGDKAVLSMSPTDSAALETKFSVLDLVAGMVLVADGQHAVSVPNLSANVGNLSPLTANAYIIEAPQMGCGPIGSPEATASTSQLHLDATLKLQAQSINGITGVTGVVQTPESTVTLVTDVGKAVGTLVAPGPVCNAGTAASPDTESVAVSTGLTTMSLTTTLHFDVKMNVLGVGAVDVMFDQAANAVQPTGSPSTANLQVPPNDVTPVSTGSPAPFGHFAIATTATNVQATTKVLGADVPVTGAALGLVVNALAGVTAQLAVNTALTDPLNGLVDNVNGLLSPLESLLGIRFAGADVFAVGRPTCNGAALRG